MNEHAVLAVGGGPTGLMLAAELKLARVDVAIVERREDPELNDSRAGGLHARSIEILEQRGVAGRFVSQGKPMPVVAFGHAPLGIADFPTRHPYTLALWQKHIERILAAWVAELGVPVYRGRDVSGFAQDDDGVRVDLADGSTTRASYVVGCDGGRSVIRKQAGIEFPGWDASISYLIAEGEMPASPAFGLRRDVKGTFAIGPIEDGRVRLVLREEQVNSGDAPTLEDLRQLLGRLYGSDFGLRNVTWLSRFSDMARQAATYRRGCVLLAGDAAHVHSPMGGQGLNLGLQDAVNLGWKLAQVVKETSPPSLLDTYEKERHPVAARALRMTLAMTALSRGDDRMDALRDYVADLVQVDGARKRIAGELTGLDVLYADESAGNPHPLLGRRMPDLELVTTTGATRVSALLHEARPVLIEFGARVGFDLMPWSDRVRRIDARYDGAWELPVLGDVRAPAAVLVRPDGHVAWVGEGDDAGLAPALTTWFGPPRLLIA